MGCCCSSSALWRVTLPVSRSPGRGKRADAAAAPAALRQPAAPPPPAPPAAAPPPPQLPQQLPAAAAAAAAADDAAPPQGAAAPEAGRATPLPSLLPAPTPTLFRYAPDSALDSARSARARAHGTLLPSPRPLDRVFLEARRREIIRSLAQAGPGATPPGPLGARDAEEVEVEVEVEV
jgi:hypothetical protein